MAVVPRCKVCIESLQADIRSKVGPGTHRRSGLGHAQRNHGGMHCGTAIASANWCRFGIA